MLSLDRITFDPNIMGGKACIRGMRVTVSLIVNLVANGAGEEEILEAYPVPGTSLDVFNLQVRVVIAHDIGKRNSFLDQFEDTLYGNPGAREARFAKVHTRIHKDPLRIASIFPRC